MMVIDEINQEAYDTYQVEIGYYKLFPLLLGDFVTRKDAKQMMLPSNLPVQTSVTVNPGQAVQVAVPAGTGSTTSPAAGNGQGTVQPTYNGSTPHAESQVLKAEIEAKKRAGGVAVDSLTEPVKKATE